MDAVQKKTTKKGTNRQYKDRLFKAIFGSADSRENALSLYNAVNDTDYQDTSRIHFNTIEDAVYMSMKNDVSFIFGSYMNFYEQQSTYNPNMPFRMFLYAAKAYEDYANDPANSFNIYSDELQYIPAARFAVFYNGKADEPEYKDLRLSDAYMDGVKVESDIVVRMLNINYGKNKGLMDKCIPLRDYAFFIDMARGERIRGKSISEAVDAAYDQLPDGWVKTFISNNRAEVKDMLLTEYDEERTKKLFIQEGERKGIEKGRQENALRMLEDGMPIESVAKYSGLTVDEVRELSKKVPV